MTNKSVHDEEKKKKKTYTHDMFLEMYSLYLLFIMVLKNFNLQISV